MLLIIVCVGLILTFMARLARACDNEIGAQVLSAISITISTIALVWSLYNIFS